MCTLQSIYFEHFLEFLADQSSSFGASKLDSPSIFVNRLVAFVGVHQKEFLVIIVSATLRYMDTFIHCASEVSCYSFMYFLYLHSQNVGRAGNGECPADEQTVGAVFPDQEREIEASVWYNNQVRQGCNIA